MAVVAYTPIARGSVKGDTVASIGKLMARPRRRSGLRWLVQQDVTVIPAHFASRAAAENFAIFDFALSDAEMTEIAGLARRGGRIIDSSFPGSPQWDRYPLCRAQSPRATWTRGDRS